MPYGDGVILLHGLGRTSASMEPLARTLRRDGHSVLNLDHPTRRAGIATLADHVEAASARWRADGTGALHLVGHSLGASSRGPGSPGTGRTGSAAWCCWERRAAAARSPTGW